MGGVGERNGRHIAWEICQVCKEANHCGSPPESFLPTSLPHADNQAALGRKQTICAPPRTQ